MIVLPFFLCPRVGAEPSIYKEIITREFSEPGSGFRGRSITEKSINENGSSQTIGSRVFLISVIRDTKYLTSWLRIFWTAAFSILLRSNSGCVAMATHQSLRLEG